MWAPCVCIEHGPPPFFSPLYATALRLMFRGLRMMPSTHLLCMYIIDYFYTWGNWKTGAACVMDLQWVRPHCHFLSLLLGLSEYNLRHASYDSVFHTCWKWSFLQSFPRNTWIILFCLYFAHRDSLSPRNKSSVLSGKWAGMTCIYCIVQLEKIGRSLLAVDSTN